MKTSDGSIYNLYDCNTNSDSCEIDFRFFVSNPLWADRKKEPMEQFENVVHVFKPLILLG